MSVQTYFLDGRRDTLFCKKRVIDTFAASEVKEPKKKLPTDCIEYYSGKVGFGYSVGKREKKKVLFPVFERDDV